MKTIKNINNAIHLHGISTPTENAYLFIYFSFYVSQVAVSLGIFAVEYPPLFGLCAIQLPMISGFLNPLLYGILWPPYRRAYIRALKWPGAKCCNRKSSSHARSHTLDCKYLGKVDVLFRPAKREMWEMRLGNDPLMEWNSFENM